MNTTINKLQQLKENDQDFEWYPTTDEMIDAIFWASGDAGSVLDVGAGDGRVLERLDKLTRHRAYKKSPDHSHNYHGSIDKFAIEKAPIHIEAMPPDISIVGLILYCKHLLIKR